MRINFGLIGLALLLSAVLWILVVNDQNPERIDVPDIAIPIEVVKVPPGLVVMNNLDPVRFRIRAPKDTWSSLRTASFRAYVDVSRLGPGIHAVSITPEASGPQVHVLEVLPSTVSVRLEEIQERTVPVKVNLVGNVPFGYVYGSPTVDPEVVLASGPASLVQTVQVASVEVRLEGITVGIDAAFHPTPVDSSSASVRNVRLTPQTVKIRLPVDQQVSYKQVSVRAALAGAAAQGYWIESVGIEPSSATVVGDPKVLAGIEYLDTATLDVSGAARGIAQDLRIMTPPGVSLLQQQTARVSVRISPLQATQVIRVGPRVINVDPSLRSMGAPSYLDVTLGGTAPALQRLRVETLEAVLDAAGLGVGVHQLRPRLATPEGVTVESTQPATVEIMLVLAPTATTRPTDIPTPTATATPTPTSATPSTPAPTSATPSTPAPTATAGTPTPAAPR